MENVFSPQDILHVAVQVENKGASLYGVLEGKARVEKVKEVWAYLKKQEQLHAEIFQKMLDNIGDYFIYETGQREYSAYFKAIASEYIITQSLVEGQIERPPSSDREAIDFGIYVEKESILTYSALKDYVQPGRQADIDKVIREEKKHLVELTLMKIMLEKGE
jgi:rubrerythrin